MKNISHLLFKSATSISSEDEGRFFHDINQKIIIHVNEGFINTSPESRIWVTLNQLKGLLMSNNLINTQLRTLISMLHIV